jgi:vancomycin resistance protein YoaR
VIVGSAVGVLLLGGGALGAGYRAASLRMADSHAHIAPGVRVAGIPVGGLTPDEAREKVRAWARTQAMKPVTLTAPVSGRQWNIPLAEAGGRFDIKPAIDQAFQVGKEATLWDTILHAGREWDVAVEPTFHFNEKLLDKQLARVARIVYQPARNAKAKVTGFGTLELLKPEEKGVQLDIAATKAALLKDGPESLKDGGAAKLVIKDVRPVVTAADLDRVGTLVGSFHTGYGSSSTSRRHNVEKAAANINGTLLGPGEIFSYNKVVGPRYRSLGWRDAPTYQDGQVVPGPGGGVCQVSTTLYNAVLRAGLKVVRRSHHSMPVHYVPAGCDATVAWDYLDFQFQNTTAAPLLVMAKTEGGKLTFSLFGEAPPRPFTADVISTDRRGSRGGGFTVSTYRVIKYADGATVREHLSTDTYKPLGASSSRRTATVRPRRRRPTATAVRKPSAAPPPAAAPTPEETPV